MPPSTTASTGLDALTQLIEAYVSNKANPMTDGICREGLKRALANAKLGAVHGFAGPLGGMIFAPHGVICAKLLSFVCEANVLALQSREPDSPALARYDQVAQILTGRASAQATDGVEWIQNLCKALTVPPLDQFDLKEQDFPTVVAKTKKSSSMKGNPIPLTDDELMKILKKCQ
jgi:alcohol dehydrogenase class IV